MLILSVSSNGQRGLRKDGTEQQPITVSKDQLAAVPVNVNQDPVLLLMLCSDFHVVSSDFSTTTSSKVDGELFGIFF